MQFRGVSKRGSLVFGGLTFTTTPRIYEMTADEAAIIQDLYGDRVSLEPLEQEVEPTTSPRVSRTPVSRRTTAKTASKAVVVQEAEEPPLMADEKDSE